MIDLFGRSIPRIELETERFVLRSLRRRELARISYPWTNDPKVMEPLEFRTGGWTQRAWEKQLIKANNRDKFSFGIEERNSGTIIGYETVRIARQIAILAVVIGDQNWWGRGVVVETRSAVLDFLFVQLDCVRAWGVVFARNFSSVSNYLSLGFRHEGTLRGHFLLPGNERGDAMVFGLLREEWVRGRAKEGARDEHA